MSEEEKNENSREDNIIIADDVIETIAGISASGVKGIFSLSGGLADGIAGVLGRKNVKKGVKINTEEEEGIHAEVSIIIEYGAAIHMVASEVQDTVRNTIEEMTGKKVASVTVNVVGVNFGETSKKGKCYTKDIEAPHIEMHEN